MDEYIKKDELLKFKADVYDEDGHVLYAVPTGFIVAMPPADVAPVRHGRWEMNSDRPDNIICTNCDVGFDVWKHEAKDFNYCPNCGAKIDLPDECKQEVER